MVKAMLDVINFQVKSCCSLWPYTIIRMLLLRLNLETEMELRDSLNEDRGIRKLVFPASILQPGWRIGHFNFCFQTHCGSERSWRKWNMDLMQNWETSRQGLEKADQIFTLRTVIERWIHFWILNRFRGIHSGKRQHFVEFLAHFLKFTCSEQYTKFLNLA